MEGVDFISDLPDPLRVTIISLLPITECVRTSVLSQRWKTMWKQSSHLSLDQREMLKPSIKNRIQHIYPDLLLANPNRYQEVMQEEEVVVAIAEATKFINSVVDAHFAGLKSCRIHHFPEICVSRNVEGWMRKLLEKGVRKISMEMELGRVDYLQKLFPLKSFIPWSIYLDFDIFSNFEELELKNYNLMTSPSDNPPKFLKTMTLSNVRVLPNDFQNIVAHCSSLENITLNRCHIEEVMIQSQSLKFFKICNMVLSKIMVYAANIEVIEINTISCNAKTLDFKTPKLQVLRSYCDLWEGEIYFSHIRKKLLRTKDILEVCSGNLISQGSKIGVFDNLVTISIDLDLNIIKNHMALCLALKSCHRLENLEIYSQVDHGCGGVCKKNEDDKYLIEHYQGICPNLKNLDIKGFRDTYFEVKFVKYIVQNVETMEAITIWLGYGDHWGEKSILLKVSSPKASTKLSITLKSGMEYMKNLVAFRCGSQL